MAKQTNGQSIWYSVRFDAQQQVVVVSSDLAAGELRPIAHLTRHSEVEQFACDAEAKGKKLLAQAVRLVGEKLVSRSAAVAFVYFVVGSEPSAS